MNKSDNNIPGSPRPVAEIVLRCRSSAPPRSLTAGEIPQLITAIKEGDEGAFRVLFSSLLPKICGKITSRFPGKGSILDRLSNLEKSFRHCLLSPEPLDRLDATDPESFLEHLLERCLADMNA